MRLSTYIQFTLKDIPDDYTGISGQSFNFGKEKYISMSDLMFSIYMQVEDWYGLFTPAAKMNSEHEKFRKRLEEMYWEEES